MKNLKLILASLALVCGIGAALAFAESNHPETNVPNLEWFQFLGGDKTDPANYQKVSVPQNCSGSGFLCAIRAEEDPTNPGHPTQAGAEDPEATQTRSTPPTP